MANLQQFEQKIEAAKAQAANIRTKMDQSAQVMAQISKGDVIIGNADFDIQSANLEDVIKQGKVMEANIADLILGLEDITNSFGAEFETMKSYTTTEKLIGFLSKKKQQSMRTDRVRATSLSDNLTDLLTKSQDVVNLLTEQRAVLQERYVESEKSLRESIESRKSTLAELDGVKAKMEELRPQLADLSNAIINSQDAVERTNLEGRHSEIATALNVAAAKEQELLAESQTYELHTNRLQIYVSSVNDQIAAQSTLINKLTIDTAYRVGMYKTLEVSLKTAAQQEVAHSINTLGTAVDHEAEKTMAGIGAAAQAGIAGLLEMHEKSMNASDNIQKNKKFADDAFLARFKTVVDKHDAAAYGG
jgi:hypothetical protein